MFSTLKQPLGCDTFVAYPPTAPAGTVVFGKNSDRPQGEGQSIRRYPAADYADKNVMLQCTYLPIPQARHTHAVLLSQIDWMWGCEMGANDQGVVIGNEAVWTNVPEDSQKLLLGMDLVRLGLERGDNSEHAMHVMIELLERHGQGGPCADQDPSFTYHNSFLIADARETWILETAGRHWCAQKVVSGGRNISNGLTIRTEFDQCSKGLKEYALRHKLWDGQEPFDFAESFSSGGIDELTDDDSRQSCGCALLQKHNGTLDHTAMERILRNHEGGICMHGGFETTSAMITQWDSRDGTCTQRHWMTGKPHPCKSEFVEQTIE